MTENNHDNIMRGIKDLRTQLNRYEVKIDDKLAKIEQSLVDIDRAIMGDYANDKQGLYQEINFVKLKLPSVTSDIDANKQWLLEMEKRQQRMIASLWVLGVVDVMLIIGGLFLAARVIGG